MASAVATVVTTAGLVAPLVGGSARASAATAAASGGSPAYWAIGAAGQAIAFHSVSYGDMSSVPMGAPIIGGAAAPDGRGYWMVNSNGAIFAFGSALYAGSEGGKAIPAPIVGMASNPSGGYWMVGRDGSIYGFGSSTLTFGSAATLGVLSPIVGMAATPDGLGYWIVSATGSVFSFGDALFYGSMGGLKLSAPIVGMVANPNGNGYWLVSSNGGVFAFGAGYYGSMGGQSLPAPVTGIAASPDGGGYWLAGQNGAVYSFGDAPFFGAAHRAMGSTPTTGIISTGTAATYPRNTTGYDVSQFQCSSYQYYSGPFPAGAHGFGVAQVSGGNIAYSQPDGCYAQEAAWAGPNEMAYIFMDAMPSQGVSRSMSGPAGNCAYADQPCQYYNYGYNWAVYWVAYAHSQNTNPTMFWLDVETGPWWAYDSASEALNSREINGAIDGLKAAGQVPGIYSTAYQFQKITGGGVSSPGIALWMAGANDLAEAQQFCTASGNGYNLNYYGPFAGGVIEMAQWTNGSEDDDYACP